ncbi:hypothetical protein C0W96_07295 [Photobacterium kishitanii]|uniref:hypothetical protein n=1 Tax=Photobacterium kishitanii TaxID=318456 RepID=UPI0005D2ECCD|nr:hypothetical protein [Photobacterium kishitanii]KJG09047.1 hypothetical protein UB40_14590 [Photobacterium kishitanii]PSV06632.1 hypothetical protein C0W96_07295 [Photobacterium kishitanii]PSV77621.1 hypothetical protein C0W29_03850 [Photobacterium kishitanii]PSW60395.1 hypothetical protein C0W54_15920 [Photobacterium kishitanii]
MKKALKINNIYINMETIVAFDLNYKIDGNRALYLLTNSSELPFLEVEVDDINVEECKDYQAQKVTTTEFIRIKRELCVYMGITL